MPTYACPAIFYLLPPPRTGRLALLLATFILRHLGRLPLVLYLSLGTCTAPYRAAMCLLPTGVPACVLQGFCLPATYMSPAAGHLFSHASFGLLVGGATFEPFMAVVPSSLLPPSQFLSLFSITPFLSPTMPSTIVSLYGRRVLYCHSGAARAKGRYEGLVRRLPPAQAEGTGDGPSTDTPLAATSNDDLRRKRNGRHTKQAA